MCSRGAKIVQLALLEGENRDNIANVRSIHSKDKQSGIIEEQPARILGTTAQVNNIGGTSGCVLSIAGPSNTQNIFQGITTVQTKENELCLPTPSPFHTNLASNYDSDHSEPFPYSSESYRPSDENNEFSSVEEVSESESETTGKQNLSGKEVGETGAKRKRSRKANKSCWKRSIVKDLRLTGQKYENRSGKEVSEKKPQTVDCSKCRFHCYEHVSQQQREILCQEYYKLADYSKQKIYLSSLFQNIPVQRKKSNPMTKNRGTSRQYYLRDSNGTRFRVCLKFFCATFAISHRVVETCAKNITASGLFVGHDKRQHSNPHNVTTEQSRQYVKEHINCFPQVDSHYCRRDTNKHYLSPDLNISVMYRLYTEEFCVAKNITPVSRFVYQAIFHDFDPPLPFFIPKKDQCSQCNAYNTATDKATLQEDYEKHKKREKDSMEMKEHDKKKALEEKGKTFRSITFDLQAILSVPYAGDSQIYYKSHLNVYNFTIFDASNADGHCYIWDETHGRKGSAEIGTCLLKYFNNLPEAVTHVSSLSDTCAGQNRNKYVAAAMLFAVNKIEHLETIDLKFMECGHFYLEADSMHATIERARRHKKIYSTREWGLLISTARIKPRPYQIYNLKHPEFYDLQNLVKEMVSNTTQNTYNEQVNWLFIKWLRFQKDKPFIIQYKYDISAESFYEMDVSDKKRSGRKRNWNTITLSKKYDSRLPVSIKKKNDLIFLLRKKIIPEDYTDFINSIPTTKNQEELNPADES